MTLLGVKETVELRSGIDLPANFTFVVEVTPSPEETAPDDWVTESAFPIKVFVSCRVCCPKLFSVCVVRERMQKIVRVKCLFIVSYCLQSGQLLIGRQESELN